MTNPFPDLPHWRPAPLAFSADKSTLFRIMQKPEPLPLPRIETSVHASSRTALTRLVATAVGHCESFESLEEQEEYFRLLRDWAAVNLAVCETSRTRTHATLVSRQSVRRSGAGS